MQTLLLALVLLVLQTGTGTITGQIVRSDGTPAAGVRLAATEGSSRSGSSALMSVTQSDAAGRYRLENVPEGSYYIVADPTGFPGYYPSGNSDPAKATSVAVRTGATVSGINFKFDRWSNIVKSVRTAGLDAGGRYFGRIVIAGGSEPMRNTSVVLRHNRTQGRFVTSSNSAGDFEFSALPDGEFTLEMLAAGVNSGRYETFESFRGAITLTANESLNQDFRLRRVITPNIARNRPDLYVPNEVRLGTSGVPRVGGTNGTGPVRGAQSSTTIPAPRTARSGKGEENVDIQVLVDTGGVVQSIRAMSPDTDPAYTRAALQAAIEWKFTPPVVTRTGEPAEQYGVVTVYFAR
jgi:TonB family protein